MNYIELCCDDKWVCYTTHKNAPFRRWDHVPSSLSQFTWTTMDFRPVSVCACVRHEVVLPWSFTVTTTPCYGPTHFYYDSSKCPVHSSDPNVKGKLNGWVGTEIKEAVVWEDKEKKIKCMAFPYSERCTWRCEEQKVAIYMLKKESAEALCFIDKERLKELDIKYGKYRQYLPADRTKDWHITNVLPL